MKLTETFTLTNGWQVVCPGAALICSDVLTALSGLPADSIDCVITSPPYWGLRDYSTEEEPIDGQIGLEPTPWEYLIKLREVFAAVHRVLRKEGTLWVNMGDKYLGGGSGGQGKSTYRSRNRNASRDAKIAMGQGTHFTAPGLKRKDLVGIPWRLALALQEDGWWLRSEIIWHKPSAMPEGNFDRPSRDHEHIFLLTKSAKYFYDKTANRVPGSPNTHPRGSGVNAKIHKANADATRAFGRKRATAPQPRQNSSFSAAVKDVVETRGVRTVWPAPESIWNMASNPRSEQHFASFPDELARRCIAAGCPEGGVVLDPFVGRGTVIIQALRLDRLGLGIDLSPGYCRMTIQNIEADAPLFNRKDRT